MHLHPTLCTALLVIQAVPSSNHPINLLQEYAYLHQLCIAFKICNSWSTCMFPAWEQGDWQDNMLFCCPAAKLSEQQRRALLKNGKKPGKVLVSTCASSPSQLGHRSASSAYTTEETVDNQMMPISLLTQLKCCPCAACIWPNSAAETLYVGNRQAKQPRR